MKELSFQATIRKQHKITIPEATREMLKIGVGDVVIITVARDPKVGSYP